MLQKNIYIYIYMHKNRRNRVGTKPLEDMAEQHQVNRVGIRYTKTKQATECQEVSRCSSVNDMLQLEKSVNIPDPQVRKGYMLACFSRFRISTSSPFKSKQLTYHRKTFQRRKTNLVRKWCCAPLLLRRRWFVCASGTTVIVLHPPLSSSFLLLSLRLSTK